MGTSTSPQLAHFRRFFSRSSRIPHRLGSRFEEVAHLQLERTREGHERLEAGRLSCRLDRADEPRLDSDALGKDRLRHPGREPVSANVGGEVLEGPALGGTVRRRPKTMVCVGPTGPNTGNPGSMFCEKQCSGRDPAVTRANAFVAI